MSGKVEEIIVVGTWVDPSTLWSQNYNLSGFTSVPSYYGAPSILAARQYYLFGETQGEDSGDTAVEEAGLPVPIVTGKQDKL